MQYHFITFYHSDEEFKSQKSSLLREKAEIEHNLNNLSTRANKWLELTEKTFQFAVYAKHNFSIGDYETKTNILRALGSNFVLKDGNIEITYRKQYQLIEKAKNMIKAKNPRLELDKLVLSKTKTDQYKSVFDTMSTFTTALEPFSKIQFSFCPASALKFLRKI